MINDSTETVLNIFRPFCGFVAAFLAFAAPAGAQPVAETLRIGLAETPGILDPATDRTAAGAILLANMCDTLIGIDPAGNLAPAAARSWTFTPDGRTLTLELRADAGFDAAQVKASLDRMRRLPHSARRGELGPIANVEALDATHVRLALDRPFVPLAASLAGRAGMIVTAFPDDDGDAVCAGPYRIASRAADGTVTLARNDAHPSRDAFAFARIAFVPVADPALRLARLRSGALDLATNIEPHDVAELLADRRVRVVRSAGPGARALLFNLTAGRPGSDPDLRQALARSVDRAALLRPAGAGLHYPGDQWVAPGTPYFANTLPVPARAPVSGTYAIELTLAAESETLIMAAAIRQQAQAAGISIRLRAFEPAVARQRVQNGDFEMALVDWSGSLDPDGIAYPRFHCRGAANDSGYCAKDVDAALDAARATADMPARKALYAAAMARLQADLPAIFLHHRAAIFAQSVRLSDLSIRADGTMRVRGLRLRD